MEISILKNKAKEIIGKDTIEFVSHSKNYITADFINKGIAFLTIPIFTRLLTPGEYGYLSLYTTIVSIFSILLVLGFRGAIGRYYYEEEVEFDSFLGTIISFLFLYNLIVIPMLYIFRSHFSDFLNIPEMIFVLGIFSAFISIPLRLLLKFFQTSKQSKIYSRLSILKQTIILPISIIWTYLLIENRYLGKINAQIVITLFLTIYAGYKLLKLSNYKYKIKKNHLVYALSYSIPLIPHALSGFILSHFDQIIINQLTGSYNTGLYSFAYKIGMIIVIISGAMNRSFTPIFYENYNKGNYNKINNIALNFSKYIFFLAVGLILFSQEVVMIMADKSYYPALSLVPVIIIGGIWHFFYYVYSTYAFYKKKTGVISFLTFSAGFLNIGLNYLLIPKFGYSVAAYTTVFTYFCLFIFHYLNVRYYLKVEGLIKFKPIFMNFLVFLTIVIFYLFIVNIISYWLILLVKIMIVLSSFYFYILKED